MSQQFGRNAATSDRRDTVLSQALRELYGEPPRRLPPSLESLIEALVDRLTEEAPKPR